MDHGRKQYGLLLPKRAESDIVSLGHGLCRSGGTHPFTIRTPAKTHSLALTMIDPATGWFEIVEATSKSATSILDFFITPYWYVTSNLYILSLIMGEWENSNVSSNKCESKKIMALKPNQLLVTTNHPQSNAIIEQVHKVVNDMLRSFELTKNHESLEEQEDNPFDYFLQSTAWLVCY
jgi:hypothetical protein